MILDQTGTLANVKRHDYMPFGEEIFAPTGLRTAGQGYAGGDGVQQQFTQKERDNETGMDYFLARFYASPQGRFVSPDTFSAIITNPQTVNRYAYVGNNPLKYIDPPKSASHGTITLQILGPSVEHEWVRELARTVTEEIKQLSLNFTVSSENPNEWNYSKNIVNLRQWLLRQSLQTGRNYSEAAKLLGVKRATLYQWQEDSRKTRRARTAN